MAADPSYTVYWYNVAGNSFGFASESAISLTESFGGDEEDKVEMATDFFSSTKERLSWSLDEGYVNNMCILSASNFAILYLR